MKSFIKDSWSTIMIVDKSPLGNIPNLMVRHMAFQILAWMWCIIFSMMVGSWIVFGISAIAHVLFISGIFITLATYRTANSWGSTQYRGDE
tara:strand:- start:795 stop:1067 length:273 start_codon:yes stop_codon:yes gene_type:complete